MAAQKSSVSGTVILAPFTSTKALTIQEGGSHKNKLWERGRSRKFSFGEDRGELLQNTILSEP